MGIRFFCPNGHRLHVKSFLAGKRGVCPDCGTAVEIPMESDARAVSSKKRAAAGGDDERDEVKAGTAVMERPEAAIEHEEPSAHDDFALPPSVGLPPPSAPPNFALENVKSASAPVLPTPVAAIPKGEASPPAIVVPSGVPLPTATVPTGAAVAAPASTSSALPPAADPISEAPMAIWYVRPAAGGQYGPARGDVMRKWVTEGRVTTDSLVWREGWPDWRPAAKVFPDLGSKATPAGDIGPVIPDSPRRVVRPNRKTTTAQGVGIVITLAVVCIGLFVALLYVLMNSGGTPTPAP